MSNDIKKSHKQARQILSKYCDLTGKDVHHIDGNPFNNNLNNLLALSRKQHYRIHRKVEGYKKLKKGKQKIKNNFQCLESLIVLYNKGIWIDTYNVN